MAETLYRKIKVPLLMKRGRNSCKLDDIECKKEAKRLEQSVTKR